MVYDTLPDSFIIQMYIEGNEEALGALIERHQTKVFGFIYSKVGNRDIADDIFQDTFIKVVHTLKTDRYNEEGKFLPWVIRIAHNLVIDHFRREKRMCLQRDHEDYSIFEFISDDSPSIDKEMMETQLQNRMMLLIGELPEDQRQVLMMRMYQDMSFKEIAESTDVSINTALGRMRYALINLRKLIDQKKIVLFE